jgi:hypothetical protein
VKTGTTLLLPDERKFQLTICCKEKF